MLNTQHIPYSLNYVCSSTLTYITSVVGGVGGVLTTLISSYLPNYPINYKT